MKTYVLLGVPLIVDFLIAAAGLLFLVTCVYHRRLKYFRIHAGKSESNALLLGGLPVALASIFTIILYSIVDPNFVHINSWICSGLIIIAYGFLDDKYEIGPKVKLVSQFLAAFVLAMNSDNEIATFVFSIALMNGTNLLDGLDTMAIKLSSITLGSLVVMGLYFGNTRVLLLCVCFLIPLLVFCFFNKEPAKVHLGEIGGGYMGLATMLLGMEVHHSAYPVFGFLNADALILISFSLPVGELCFSFLRRICSGKSPFKGDKLHVHHILKRNGRSATKTTNIMAVSYIFALTCSISVAILTNPLLGFLTMVTIQSALYLYVGWDDWFARKTHRVQIFPAQKNALTLVDNCMIDAIHFDLESVDKLRIREAA